MGTSDYSKSDVVSFGHALGDLVNAARDGVSVDDFDELIGTVTKAGSIVNEMKDVPEAAIEHTVGALSDRLGDHALAKAVAAEAGSG